MASLQPREVTKSEIDLLYFSQNLELQQVQVLMRHGERTPVSSRFKNAGLIAHWPACNAVTTMRSVIRASNKELGPTENDWNALLGRVHKKKVYSITPDTFPKTELVDVKWDGMTWNRKLETFGSNDERPVLTQGPDGETDGICLPGELTDRGRASTMHLGQRLRRLYVNQLGFMPRILEDTDSFYIRATPIPRALESVQQAFTGMYPRFARSADFTTPTIILRAANDETLFPNDSNCRRFAELARAFADRAATRWNNSPEMIAINKKIARYMPSDSRVAVDGKPRLSGIMDTINSVYAQNDNEIKSFQEHDTRIPIDSWFSTYSGPPIGLPRAFFDLQVRKNIEKIGVEEWFQGYNESEEYRRLGIGGLLADITGRMVDTAGLESGFGLQEVIEGKTKPIKFALSGCHDTTLAATLASLGCLNMDEWPPYTSHIAIELFRKKQAKTEEISPQKPGNPPWQSKTLSLIMGKPLGGSQVPIGRVPLDKLDQKQVEALEDYYVRVRYNDKVMQIPGCRLQGNHLKGDTSLCTLKAFKGIVDKFTPKNWKAECRENLGAPTFQVGQKSGM